MKRQLVLKYRDNGINYVVYRENNEFLAAKVVNNKLVRDLSEEEKITINLVFDNMLLGDNANYIGNIPFLKKIIKQYIDENGNLIRDDVNIDDEGQIYMIVPNATISDPISISSDFLENNYNKTL